MQKQLTKKQGAIVFLASLVITFVVAVWGYFVILEIKSAQYWPTVKGEITISKVKESTRRNNNSRRSSTEYKPYICYKYEVNDTSYVSSRYSMGSTGSGKKYARELVRKYAVGTEVDVFYNPEKPKRSTLVLAKNTTPGYAMMVPFVIYLLLTMYLFYSGSIKLK